MNNQEPYIQEDYDEIDLKELCKKLLSKKKMIIKWCCISAVIGIVVAFSIPKSYIVSSIMAPEMKQSKSSNLGTLASLAGISLANLSTSDAMTPELYETIIYSNPFIVNLFSVPLQFTDKNGEPVETDVYNYFKSYQKSPWWSKLKSAPGKLIKFIKKKITHKPAEPEGYAQLNPYQLTKEQTDITNKIRDHIKINLDARTYVTEIKLNAQNANVAADLCTIISNSLKQYIDDYHYEKAQDDLKYYQTLYEQSQSDYFKAQETLAEYQDSHQGIVTNSNKIELKRLQNDADLKYSLYNGCAQQVQQAQARLFLETPDFTIISPASVPTKASKPQKKLIVLGFILFAAFLSCGWVLIEDSVKSFFKKEEE